MFSLRHVFFALALAVASMAGAPMRIEQVNEVMRAINQPTISSRRKRKRGPAPVIPIDSWRPRP